MLLMPALSDKRGQITQAAAEVIKQWGLDYDDKEKAFRWPVRDSSEHPEKGMDCRAKENQEVKNHFGGQLGGYVMISPRIKNIYFTQW